MTHRVDGKLTGENQGRLNQGEDATSPRDMITKPGDWENSNQEKEGPETTRGQKGSSYPEKG